MFALKYVGYFTRIGRDYDLNIEGRAHEENRNASKRKLYKLTQRRGVVRIMS